MHKVLLVSVASTAVALVACGRDANDPASLPPAPPAAAPRANPPVGAPAPALTAPPAARDPIAARRATRATDTSVAFKESFPLQFNACDLISTEEAAEAAGAPVSAPESRWGAKDANCIFHVQDGDGSWPGAVYLQIRVGAIEYEKSLELAARENATLEMLEALGDRAFYTTLFENNIVVAAKGLSINLIVRDNPAAPNREQAIDLARRVVDRLR